MVRESRPVRKVMSRAKRAEITENFETAAEDNVRFDFDAVVDNKVSIDDLTSSCCASPPTYTCFFAVRRICRRITESKTRCRT